jgi:hypothetical protein
METTKHKPQRNRLRKRRSNLPPEELLNFIRSEHYSAIARYTASLTLLGSGIHMSVISISGKLKPVFDKTKKRKATEYISDEREENVKTMGSPARSLSPPAEQRNQAQKKEKIFITSTPKNKRIP